MILVYFILFSRSRVQKTMGVSLHPIKGFLVSWFLSKVYKIETAPTGFTVFMKSVKTSVFTTQNSKNKFKQNQSTKNSKPNGSRFTTQFLQFTDQLFTINSWFTNLKVFSSKLLGLHSFTILNFFGPKTECPSKPKLVGFYESRAVFIPVVHWN